VPRYRRWPVLGWRRLSLPARRTRESDGRRVPRFQLCLPNGGPLAHGRLLAERGTNGSQKFMVLAGSPTRADSVPSFPARKPSSYGLREQLISDGVFVQSTQWPGWLEATRDITCNSPSAAAEIVMGHGANGYRSWKTLLADVRTLAGRLLPRTSRTAQSPHPVPSGNG
jgi:Domain of unknown function (DUF4357)